MMKETDVNDHFTKEVDFSLEYIKDHINLQ